MRAHEDQRGTARFGTRIVQRLPDGGKIVAVVDGLGVPAVSFETSRAVFGKRDIRARRERDPIVVVEVDQLAELQWPASDAASDATPSIRSPSLTMP